MIKENKSFYLYYWILIVTILVAIMIVVGGLTRLTDSGLSITRWDLFTGILPPITKDDWDFSFSLYKEIPEYTLINSGMTLNEFKVIFLWEYFHRLLGRLIGLSFLIPFIIFSIKKFLNKKMFFSFLSIFILICFQGFIGWYMVQSGLTERTDVSHYRLSFHLTFGFIIYILLFWNLLKLGDFHNDYNQEKLSGKLPYIFFILVVSQISLGALVSGLDAGQIYQTWPLMGLDYFPDDSYLKDIFSLEVLENPSIVQFFHRNLAYLITIIFLIISYNVLNNNKLYYLRKYLIFIFIALSIQIILGILTILSGAHIILASMHQLGSIFLITSILIFLFKNSKINLQLSS